MSLMDLSSVVLSLASGTYPVTRHVAGTYDASGIYVPGATSTLSATGSMQPADGRVTQRLPEGKRGREARVFFTPTALLSSSEGQEPDTLVADGATWEVDKCERWAELGNYYRAVLLKVGRT